MKPEDITQLKKLISQLQAEKKGLQEEAEIKNKAINILIVSGHLDERNLALATELAGGI